MAILVSNPAKPSTPEPDTLLSRKRALTPRGEYVTMPMFGQVWVELAGEVVVDEIESAVFSAMAELKLPPTALNAFTYESRRLALTLAWAVRPPEPDKRQERAGTPQQWIDLDIDLINACGIVYADVRERLNPIGSGNVTVEQFEEIRLAHEKKNARGLRIFGLAMLSNYLATTDAPPARSPTTSSSSGQS